MRITVAIDGDGRPSRELVARAVDRAVDRMTPPEPGPEPGWCRLCQRPVDGAAVAAGWDVHPECADGRGFWAAS